MYILLRALLFGIITALAAYVARKGIAVYHDGLRPSIPELSAGRMSRKEARKYTRNISTGFIVSFAAPFSIVSGIMVSHIVFLIADWIGVGLENVALVLSAGFSSGFLASLAVSIVTWALNHMPHPVVPDFQLIARPVLSMLPIMPIIAVHAASRSRRLTVVAVVLVCLTLLFWPNHIGVDPQTAGLIVGSIVLLVWALSKPEAASEPVQELIQNASAIRRNAIPMILIGITLGVAGAAFWIAGEPGAAMLLFVHRPIDAAVLGIFSWIGFLPMVTYSSLGSKSYTAAGIPDGVPAVGYLSASHTMGGILGGLLMTMEVTQLHRFESFLRRFPRMHSVGSGIREGMTLVLDIALLIGGAWSANALWPGIGVFVVGLIWLLNEAYGVRLMRLAVGPVGAILTALLINAYQLVH